MHWEETDIPNGDRWRLYSDFASFHDGCNPLASLSWVVKGTFLFSMRTNFASGMNRSFSASDPKIAKEYVEQRVKELFRKILEN